MTVTTIDRPHPHQTAAARHATRPCSGPATHPRTDTDTGRLAYLAYLARRALIWIGGYLGVALIIYLASLVAN